MMHKSGTSEATRARAALRGSAPGSPRKHVVAAERGPASRDWVVLRVQPKTEFDTAETLHERGHDALVPFESKYRRFGRRRRRVLCRYPLFPCYVFAECTENGHAASHSGIRTVLGVMTADERPYRLTEDEISWVIQLTMAGAPTDGMNLHNALRAGQWAQIAQGPLSGALGYIDRIRGQRASVLTEMLGVWRAIEMPLDALEVA